MREWLIVFLVLSFSAGACTAQTGTSPSAASTNSPPIPTVMPATVIETPYPTPTFSPTFTALPPLQPGQGLVLTSLYMMDESSGWGLENNKWDARGHILHTRDGGATWQDVTPPQGA